MPTLESRIATLERQNRTLRASLLLGAITLVTCGGISSDFELVRTNTLVIFDAQERAKLTLSSNGTITFQHSQGPVVLDAEAVRKLLATPTAAAR